MSIRLQRDAVNETFGDVEKLVYDTAHKFRKRYGGEIQELISEANELFMDAYKAFTPGRAAFSTWCRFKVWHGLLESLRRQITRNSRFRDYGEDGLKLLEAPEGFNLSRFLNELSPDARLVTSLVIDPPPNVRLSIVERNTKIRNPRNNLRESVWEHLTDLGWEENRIGRAFLEVTNALKE